MAFDPRTGITSYAPSGAAAVDPSAAAAGVVPAPSTATSLDALYDKYFPEWRTSDPYGGAAPSPGASYDPYNSVWQGGAGPLDVAGRAAQSGNLFVQRQDALPHVRYPEQERRFFDCIINLLPDLRGNPGPSGG